jgi:hypothetical protein
MRRVVKSIRKYNIYGLILPKKRKRVYILYILFSPYYLITLLPYYLITLLPYYIITLLPYSFLIFRHSFLHFVTHFSYTPPYNIYHRDMAILQGEGHRFLQRCWFLPCTINDTHSTTIILFNLKKRGSLL